MTTLQQLATSQSNLPIRINENFSSCSPAAIFGMNPATTNGLTWGYYGGAINNAGTLSIVGDGVIALTPSNNNYVEATPAGVVSVSHTGFNLASGNTPLYLVVTSSSMPTTITDYRVLGTTNTASSSSSSFTTDVTNRGSGELTLSGATVATGSTPSNVKTSNNGRFCYVSNGFGNSISQYSIGANGTLVSIATAISTYSNPVWMDIDSLDRWLYAACSTSGDIAQFNIGATGALTSIGANIAAGSGVAAVKVHPNGKYLYAVGTNTNLLYYYSINQTTGALTALGSIATGTNPMALDIDVSGGFLVVANKTGGLSLGSVSKYTLANGVPTVNGTATAVSTNAFNLKFHPNSANLYVANVDTLAGGTGNLVVDIFPHNTTTGALGTKTSFGLTGTGNNSGLGMDIDRLGRYLALSNAFGHNVTSLLIALDGSLSLANSISSSGDGIALDASLRFAYSALGSGNVVRKFVINNFIAGSGGFYGNAFVGGEIRDAGNRLTLLSNTAPTISSGFGTTPAITANNTSAFKIVIGTGGTASSGVITLPAATNGWIADANDVTNNALFVTSQSAETTTSVTLTNYSRTTGAVTPWTAGDEIHVRCAPY